MVGLTYIIVLYVFDNYDHYQDYRIHQNVIKLIVSALLGTVVVILLFYFPLGVFIGRYLIVIQAVFFGLLITCWRYVFSTIAMPERLQRPAFIIGAGNAGEKILEAIYRRPASGLVLKGFIDDDPKKLGKIVKGLEVLGNSSDLKQLMDKHPMSLAIVAITHEKSKTLLRILTRLNIEGFKLLDMPSMYEFLAGKIPIDHISDGWFFFNNLNKTKYIYRKIKRVFDLVFSLLVLMTSWPFILLFAAAIKLDSEGPIFYFQSRLGQNGNPFHIIKLRTMIHNQTRERPRWACENDPRVTRVGSILRKFHMDELPQFVNILKGDMSLIGPRAEWDVFAQDAQRLVPDWGTGRRIDDSPGSIITRGYKERIPYYSYRLMVKPGLTGWAQVKQIDIGSSLEGLREKLQYDLYYIKNMGLLLDLSIILKTVGIIFFGRGK